MGIFTMYDPIIGNPLQFDGGDQLFTDRDDIRMVCSGGLWQRYFEWLQKVAIITSSGEVIKNASINEYGEAASSNNQTYDLTGTGDDPQAIGMLMETYKALRKNKLFKNIPLTTLYEELEDLAYSHNRSPAGGFGGAVDKYHGEQSIDICYVKNMLKSKTPFLGFINDEKADIRFYINPTTKIGESNKHRITALIDIFLHRVYDKIQHRNHSSKSLRSLSPSPQ
jgi:hypothetical protein